MIKLNDYLYSGHTVLKILHSYTHDLEQNALSTGNRIDLIHCSLLNRITELLEHNDFLTSQSQRMRDFYMYMSKNYPYLAFTFKGRIKSLIRAEQKFNGYIVSFIHDYYMEHGCFPSEEMLEEKLTCFRDLIAYRIVISMPRCHLKNGENRETTELKHLYEIANVLPEFLSDRGFTAELSELPPDSSSPLDEQARPYYRDYIATPSPYGYRSLHITLYDVVAKCYMEVQLRTKEMDDDAEIGPANHLGYEKRQQEERSRRDAIPFGECIWFDEAFEREQELHLLDLSKLDVNMFAALNNSLINDGCGLYRGRWILPFEHLSRFQNDLIG